jgi:hypothetical protein
MHIPAKKAQSDLTWVLVYPKKINILFSEAAVFTHEVA